MTSNDIQDIWNNVAEKSTSDLKKISPLGISRYGRTRKPKISRDFCSIDDVIDNNEDDVKDSQEDRDFFMKESKLPTKTYNRLKSSLTSGAQISIKEMPVKPKCRTMHNNNSEVLHITGDSDVSYTQECKTESVQKCRKFFKTSENIKLPTVKHIYVTKEKMPEIKDKKLSEELKPILSEEIFQNSPIDISEVFKIISNKSHDLELEINAKQNTKNVLKTYTNKRKNFKKPSSLIESFGLPDEPIVPITNETIAQPLRISEIDVEVVKPESVNLINRDFVDSLWKISAPENNYGCQNDNDMFISPVFDVRGRCTPIENNIDENIHYSKTTSSNKMIKISEIKTETITPIAKASYANNTSNRSQNGSKILKTCTEENIIPDSSQDLKNFKYQNKSIIKKRISDVNTNFIKPTKNNENRIFLNSSSSNDMLNEELKPIKTENNFSFEVKFEDTHTPKKSVCNLVYEIERDNVINQEKNVLNSNNKEKKSEESTSMTTNHIEAHSKISLINKDVTDKIENDGIHTSNDIDINKLKNQINSRIEIMTSEEKPLLQDQEDRCDDAIPKVEKENDTISTTPNIHIEKCLFELGDLMWAKVGTYPYWPCLITEEPGSKEYKKSDYRNIVKYHVRFFADNGRRSWISEKNLLPYAIDLSKIQKESKQEVILPQPKSRSYNCWMMGIKEADSVKGKLKKERLKFFSKMFVGKRLNKKNRVTAMINKRQINRIAKKEISMKNKDTHRLSKAVNSGKLKKEILENLKDMVTTGISKRITRSSLGKRSVSKSRPTTSKKEMKKSFDKTGIKRKILNEYSEKHESLSNSSDDEVSSKSSVSLTVEYQTALYKRNNLFKGISKERVCQICEKPNGVIKCKGRCNGYYHMICASRRVNVNQSNSCSNKSLNTQELQLSAISSITNGDDKQRKQIKITDTFDNELKIINDTFEKGVDYEKIKNEQNLCEEKEHKVEFPKRRTRSSYQNSELENEVKNEEIEEVIQNLEHRPKKKNSQIIKIETPAREKGDDRVSVPLEITRSNSHEQEIMKPEMKYDSELFLTQTCRMTRSHSQEREIVKAEPENDKSFVQNRRITRSCSQESETKFNLLKNNKMEKSLNRNHSMKKQEIDRDKKNDNTNPFGKPNTKKDLQKEDGGANCLDDNRKNRQKERKSLNQIFTSDQNTEKNLEENKKHITLSEIAKPKENQILLENKVKNEIDHITNIVDYKIFEECINYDKKIIKTENTKSSNVKIVNIKSRKKSVNSPTLTLNTDAEFENLPLHAQIDHKMKEIMQKIDRNPLYADSTTDYTSSEESALDLLSPRGKKMKDNLEMNLKRELESRDSNYSKITSEVDIFDLDKSQIKEFKSKSEFQSEADFKCLECLEDIDHICFVCHKEIARSGSNIRQKCSLFPCGKFYHPECLKVWPQTQWSVISSTKHKQSNTELDTFVCPVHVCHTCVSDDPRAAIPRCTSDKVVKCLRCPATYHNSAYCIPAGTEILTSTQIICPRHLIPNRMIKQALPIINTTWCFICSEGGNLICCEMCPTSVHAECLDINLTEDDTFICEDCETGRFPLYDEIVWVKLGSYRWWPAVILFPNEVPDKVKNIKHKRGEFVVRFFGTYDHYWIGRGRVFLFQEGDSGEACSNKRMQKENAMFEKSIQEASEAHAIKKEFKQAIIEEAAVKLKHKPPPYIKIKVNRPVGNVRQFDGNISNTTPCECNPKMKNPCGADSDCLNRLLSTECNPEVCPAGEKCQNQNFEKRNYPHLVPYRTQTRGWGLKSLDSIKKGQFVIEYVGEMIDEQEYQRRIKKMHAQKEENYYFLTIDKDRMLDAGPKGNVARFMNHSCQPNCETQKWTVNGDTRVGLFSVNDIPANTELTFNYNLACVGKEKKICKCGAPNCSGYIGVKVKQGESRKKLKTKVKHKKKRSFPVVLSGPANNDPCFICGQVGDVSPCNNKICTKHYHLKCVNLSIWPDNKWACPWHNCNICSKRTIRCCVKCVNSYCPIHSEGNVRYDKLLGFICSEHDPNKADSLEIKMDNSKKKDIFSQKITEENDVTSTTCDELDQNICEQLKESGQQEIEQLRDCQLTPRKLSDNLEVVTSTPIKFENDDPINSIISQQFDTYQPCVNSQQKRKRGRPRKSLVDPTSMNEKRIKLDENEGIIEIEEKSKLVTLSRTIPSRNLRTTKVVNYGGLSEKLIAAQRKLDNNLQIRKRSAVRCETVL